MTKQMRGLSKLHAREGLWLVEAPVPEPGPEDVIIRVHRTAIYNWDKWAARTIKPPMIVGHEYAGEIVEIGAAVTRKLHVGQRVSGEGHLIDINSTAARRA